MLKVEVMNLSPGRIVLRFYLMMAVVLLAGFTGIWLLGLLAHEQFARQFFPIFKGSNPEKVRRGGTRRRAPSRSNTSPGERAGPFGSDKNWLKK
ncbi:MAG: hypothetical protein AAFR05_14465 [Bacteroidota bacterium]